jgi:hypothetical protein
MITTKVIVCICCVLSLTHGAQWTDLTDGIETYDGSISVDLIDNHVYQPTAVAAWTGEVRLPESASVTIGAAAVGGFLGNTYSQLTVASGGTLKLYGSIGVPEVITTLVKSARGNFTLEDHTAGGLRVVGFSGLNGATVSEITINTFGVGTVLDLHTSLLPAGAAQPLTLNVQASSIVTLITLTSVPRLSGRGRLILGDTLRTLTMADVSRIANFRGQLVTSSAGTTDITFSADTYVWTLSGVAEVPYSVLKAMRGTVRLPASTRIVF